MAETLSPSQLLELVENGADVATTVYSFRDAEIRRFVSGDLCLLEISGLYSSFLAKEIEKLVATWKGDLGMAFRDIKVDPRRRRKFDPSIVGILRKTLTRMRRAGKTFTLCSPPTELIDMLKLTGTLDHFKILDGETSDTGQQAQRKGLTASAIPGPQGDPSGITPGQKKIQFLSQSLQRTVKLEKGLDSAAKYVKRFLPQSPPQAEGFEFAFLYRSSEKVGGDFFDFISLGDQRLGICIGDVAGHGMDAAFLMGITKKVIRIRAVDDESDSPRRVLCRASRDISEDFSASRFVTTLYGVLHTDTGAFTFTRAGHEHPMILGPDPGSIKVVETKGVPLGMDKLINLESALDETTIQLVPGAFLLLYTDGLPEARSERGVQYTRERLAFDLNRVCADMSCREVLERLSKGLNGFTGGAPQEDDMTVVLVKRNTRPGRKGSAG